MGAEVWPLLIVFSFLNLWLTWFNSWAVKPRSTTFTVPGPGWTFTSGGFEFPFFYSFFHTIMSCLGSYIVLKLKGVESPTVKEFCEYKWGLLPCAFLFTTNVGCNNASLVSVSVFINAIIKTLVPIPTMVAEFLINKIIPTWQTVLSVAVIVLGAALCVEFKSGTSSLAGVMLVLTATVSTAVRPVFAAELMSGKTRPKLHPAKVLFYEQTMAIGFMILFTLADFQHLTAAIQYLGGEHAGLGFFIITVGALTAFAYNLVTFYFTKAASALTMVITGTSLKVVLIVLGAFQDNIFNNWIHILGLCIFLFGISAYSYVQYAAKQNKAAKAAASKSDVEKGRADAASDKSAPVTESTPLNPPVSVPAQAAKYTPGAPM